jgi:Ca-activated chloride channel family protein
MSVNEAKDLKQIMLAVVFAAIPCLLAIVVIGQSEAIQQTLPTQKPEEGQTKPASMPAQTPSAAQPPQKAEAPPVKEKDVTSTIKLNLVSVPVSVTDGSGEPVPNLNAEDFQIEDEGKSQQVVALGEPGKTPVELALLFDVSRSVSERFRFGQQAVSRFLKETLKPNDAASIFTIGYGPKLVHTRAVGGAAAVTAAMAVNPTEEATAFFDTVVEVAQYLIKTAEPVSRQVMVVISDGVDTVSEKYRLKDALRELQRADCLFYSINPSGQSIRLKKISLKGQNGMISLATTTGGAAFLPNGDAELDRVFRQIAAELQAQYLLGYYAPDERADGAFRRITVRVPKRPELRVRARQGYYAPKP